MTDLIKLHAILINLGEVPRVRGSYMFTDKNKLEFNTEGELVKVTSL